MMEERNYLATLCVRRTHYCHIYFSLVSKNSLHLTEKLTQHLAQRSLVNLSTFLRQSRDKIQLECVNPKALSAHTLLIHLVSFLHALSCFAFIFMQTLEISKHLHTLFFLSCNNSMKALSSSVLLVKKLGKGNLIYLS